MLHGRFQFVQHQHAQLRHTLQVGVVGQEYFTACGESGSNLEGVSQRQIVARPQFGSAMRDGIIRRHERDTTAAHYEVNEVLLHADVTETTRNNQALCQDNLHLRHGLERRDARGQEKLITAKFKYAMAFAGLALYQLVEQQDGNGENGDFDYRKAASAIAKVITPIIRQLVSLELKDFIDTN